MRNEINGKITEKHVFERKIEHGDEVEFRTVTLLKTDTGNYYYIGESGKTKWMREYTYHILFHFFKTSKHTHTPCYTVS